MSETFSRSLRIRDGRDFTAILKRGRYAADRTLVVNVRVSTSNVQEPDCRGVGRLGITIPRKAGNAVVRNRWKRLIREAYRTQKAVLPPGYDVVVRPRRGATCDGVAIRKSLVRLVRRATGPNRGGGAEEGGNGARGKRRVERPATERGGASEPTSQQPGNSGPGNSGEQRELGLD